MKAKRKEKFLSFRGTLLGTCITDPQTEQGKNIPLKLCDISEMLPSFTRIKKKKKKGLKKKIETHWFLVIRTFN